MLTQSGAPLAVVRPNSSTASTTSTNPTAANTSPAILSFRSISGSSDDDLFGSSLRLGRSAEEGRTTRRSREHSSDECASRSSRCLMSGFDLLIALVMLVGLVGVLIPVLPGLVLIWLAGVA